MNNRQTKFTLQKCLRCGYEDHLIAKCPRPPKDNYKRQKQVCFNEKGTCAFGNGLNNSDQKIHTSMTCMSANDKFPGGNFGDTLQITNWVLNSGATGHTTPEVSDIITGWLEHMDKRIEVSDVHHITEKKNDKHE